MLLAIFSYAIDTKTIFLPFANLLQLQVLFLRHVYWNDRGLSLSSKIRLMCSLVTPIFLYAFESLTLTAELQRRIQAVETRCYRRILRVSYKDHVTNEEVHAKIQ